MRKKTVPIRNFICGEIHENKFTGTRLTEIISSKKISCGWIWSLSDGRVVVSPSLGFYLWYDPNNEHWTFDSGGQWLSSR